MASQTTNLNLVKPAYGESADVAVFNGNMDLIDAFAGTVSSGKAAKSEAIKNITRNGTTFTATRADGTTFTFTQQDYDHFSWSDITNKPSYYDGAAIKNITRSGTTFTATKMDGTTFTFTQQDNNTTYNLISRGSGAGLAPGLPSGSGTTKYLREDGSWQVPPNSVYTLPLAANGTRGGVQLGYSTNGKNYAVQQSSEKLYVNVPWVDTNTDTNTWRPVQNNLTSESTTDCLSANMGRYLSNKMSAVGHYYSTSVVTKSVASGTFVDMGSLTIDGPGRWLCIARLKFPASSTCSHMLRIGDEIQSEAVNYSNYTCTLNGQRWYHVSEATSVTFGARQDSGSSQNVEGYMFAIRLCPT